MGFLSFLLNNAWAKWLAIIGAVYVVIRTKEEVDERRGYRRAIERGEKRTRKIQEQNRKDLDEKSAQTDRARDSVQPVSGSASVPDKYHGILFGDERGDS